MPATRSPRWRPNSGYASQGAYAALGRLDTVVLIAPQPGAKHTAAEQAKDRMRSPNGRQAAVDRQAHAEGAISELKRHGADRARCRGTRLLQLQLLGAATAINLKRLLAAGNAACTAQPGDPSTNTATIRSLTRLLVHTLNEINHSPRPKLQRPPSEHKAKSAEEPTSVAEPRGAVERTTELSDDLIQALDESARAAIDALGRFVVTLEEASPTRSQGHCAR